MVTVTSATSTKPTVWPLTQCGSGAGETVTLGCLATGFTPSSVTYSWTKDDAALTDSIQYPPVLKGEAYTGISQMKVPRRDWESKAVYKCVVTNTAGNGQATFQPPPPVPCVFPTLKVLASYEEGQEASFTCFARDFSPNSYQMKWLKNGADIANKLDEITTDSKERLDNGTTLYSTASFLTLPSSEWAENDEITCRFVGKSASCPAFVNSSVVYQEKCPPGPTPCPEAAAEITIIDPTLEDIFLKNKGTVVCRVQENKPSVTKIMWEDEHGNEMVSSTMTPINNNKGKKLFSLSLDITYEEWNQGVRRYCSVEHEDWIEPHKALYERRSGGQFQRPSVFMLPPVEHTRKEMVTLTCYVRDFYPQEVYVSWLVDDVEADSTEYEFHTTEPVDNHGTYSAYSQLLLRLDQWQRKDVVYSCAVHHESVSNATKAIVRSIGYTTFDKTNLVNLNLNLPETCKAQ